MTSHFALFELVCLGIVILYLALRLRHAARPRRLLGRYLLLALAGGLAEELAIRWYAFYLYDAGWTVKLGHVPVMVMLIWPCVIISAWDISRHLLGRDHRLVPLVGGAIVLADASVIEPVAVRAGLWGWSEPGFFDVPPIGVLGWAFFGGAAIWILSRVDRTRGPAWRDLLVIPGTAALSHAALVATWWVALRWVNHAIPDAAAIVVAWAVSLGLSVAVFRAKAWRRLSLGTMLVRVPPSILFFILLAVGDAPGSLIGFAVAFAPPYLLLTPWRGERPRG